MFYIYMYIHTPIHTCRASPLAAVPYCWGVPLTPYHAPREDWLCSRLLIICARLLNKYEVPTEEGLGPVLGSCSFVLTCVKCG